MQPVQGAVRRGVSSSFLYGPNTNLKFAESSIGLLHDRDRWRRLRCMRGRMRWVPDHIQLVCVGTKTVCQLACSMALPQTSWCLSRGRERPAHHYSTSQHADMAQRTSQCLQQHSPAAHAAPMKTSGIRMPAVAAATATCRTSRLRGEPLASASGADVTACTRRRDRSSRGR